MSRINKTKIFGVYEELARKRKIYTKNLTPGKTVYDEELVKTNDGELREWNPYKSKLGAYIMQKGVNDIFIRPGSSVLYLGIASGTSASHISDIIGKDGMIYGIDPAFRVMIDLMFVAEERKNIAPILDDAAHPEHYKNLVPKEVDFIIQDVAQRNQSEIFIKNVDRYLKKDGFAMIAIKAKSIDIAGNSKKIFKDIRDELEKKYTIVDSKKLEPFEKDHMMIVIKKK
ncbi:fibrillarin-like rRNA/tRNA 2'-O-methyltransferase [Candidatus Woesearchaeota archaeon]|nr:fibrillarin-like rRNA/tRNA 2'-O-methyltransferase [Candidatus Woesearchaeota archaeon]